MYNIELFNMFTTSYVSHFVVEAFPIGVDYISPRTYQVEAPADLVVELKNTVRVKDIDYNNTTVFVGFVQGFEKDRNKTVLTLAPMMMLLNEISMQNVFDESSSQNWGYQIYQQIYNDFMRTTPSIYKIPWYYASGSYPYSLWGNTTKVGYSAELKNDMECVISRRKAKGRYMRFAIGVASSSLGRPYFGFYNWNSSITFEADLENVVERKISETNKEGFNNALIWYPRDNLGNYNSYSAGIKNGVIVYGYDERLSVDDPRLTQKVLDHDPDQDERVKLFSSMLQPGASNFEIELTYKRDDALIPNWGDTGRPCTIITSQKSYDTYLTGYERNGDLLTLKFGTVRQDLTSILNREDS